MTELLKTENRGFKRKTIVHIIEAKINSWLKSIEDEALKKLIKNNLILTGGAITSLLQGDQPNDYDIYFKNYEAAKSVAIYYLDKIHVSNDKMKCFIDKNVDDRIKIVIKSAGVIRSEEDNGQNYDYFEQTQNTRSIESYLNKEAVKSKEKYAVAMITSNAISLNNDVQLIFRFFGSPEEIHQNYDFLHVTNYYTQKDGLVLKADALEAIMSKTLHYVGSRYPICSMFRIRKFIKRGWSISAGEMLKIAWDINKLDLDDMDVVYEQLVGVDAAYFHQLIDLLKLFQNNNPTVDLDRSYLFALINKVFNDVDVDLDDHDVASFIEDGSA